MLVECVLCSQKTRIVATEFWKQREVQENELQQATLDPQLTVCQSMARFHGLESDLP